MYEYKTRYVYRADVAARYAQILETTSPSLFDITQNTNNKLAKLGDAKTITNLKLSHLKTQMKIKTQIIKIQDSCSAVYVQEFKS